MKKPVTIREVARVSGVHHSVAGAVLNGTKGNTRVSPSTRDRVREAAEDLGYQPNESAQNLRGGTSTNVCLAGGDLRNPFFAELAVKLEAALLQSGLRLLITHAAQSREDRHKMVASLRQRHSIRTMIYWEEPTEAEPDHWQKEMTPHVIPIGYTLSPRPGVWLNLAHGMRLAVSALTSRGRHKLGFYLPGSDQESQGIVTRRQAFLEECRAADLPPPVVCTFQGDSYDIASATRDARPTLAQNPEVEGWVGFNDIASLALLMARSSRNDTPEVFCFDGTAIAREWPGSPPFLDLHLDDMVKQCAEIIAKDLQLAEGIVVQPTPGKRV